MGTFIRNLREKRNLSQGQVAEYTGVSQATISKVEAGEMPNVSAINLAKLSLLFGVTVDHILEQAGILPAAADEQKAAFAMFIALAKADPTVYQIMLTLCAGKTLHAPGGTPNVFPEQATGRLHRPPAGVELTCAACGRAFRVRPSRAAKCKHCSRDCRLKL